MKINPNNFLEIIKKDKKNLNVLLFYGNENGLIYKLTRSVFNTFKEKFGIHEITYFDHKNDKENTLEDIFNKQSLFSEINFIVLKNPQESLVEQIKKITVNNNILIVNGEGINAKSKIKKYFDNHKNHVSVPCYKLTKADIKNIIDSFLSTNNINLEKSTYWFLIENISEDYLVLEKELEKLYSFKNLSLTINDLRKIIIQKNNINVENYFFNCVNGNYQSIIKDMNSSVVLIDDSYEILRCIKRFLHILVNIKVNMDIYNLEDLIKTHVPKYLFMKESLFRDILKKISKERINEIIKLIQKTEQLLRKNSQQHKEITERFLLNVAKKIR